MKLPMSSMRCARGFHDVRPPHSEDICLPPRTDSVRSMVGECDGVLSDWLVQFVEFAASGRVGAAKSAGHRD